MHRILLKPETESVSKGGIVIPKSDKELALEAETGEVVAIGDTAFEAFGYKKGEAPIKVGDKVWFARYGARRIQFTDDPQVYIACNDEDILFKDEDE